MDFKSMLIGALGTALLFVSLGAGVNNSETATPTSIDEDLIITADELAQYESYRLGGASVIDGYIYQVVEIQSVYTWRNNMALNPAATEQKYTYPFRLIACHKEAR